MEDLVCSLGECKFGPLTGMVVILGNEGDDEDVTIDPEGVLLNYTGSKRPFALLHPNCFIAVFNELTMAEANVNLIVYMGGVGDVRLALQM